MGIVNIYTEAKELFKLVDKWSRAGSTTPMDRDEMLAKLTTLYDLIQAKGAKLNLSSEEQEEMLTLRSEMMDRNSIVNKSIAEKPATAPSPQPTPSEKKSNVFSWGTQNERETNHHCDDSGTHSKYYSNEGHNITDQSSEEEEYNEQRTPLCFNNEYAAEIERTERLAELNSTTAQAPKTINSLYSDREPMIFHSERHRRILSLYEDETPLAGSFTNTNHTNISLSEEEELSNSPYAYDQSAPDLSGYLDNEPAYNESPYVESPLIDEHEPSAPFTATNDPAENLSSYFETELARTESECTQSEEQELEKPIYEEDCTCQTEAVEDLSSCFEGELSEIQKQQEQHRLSTKLYEDQDEAQFSAERLFPNGYSPTNGYTPDNGYTTDNGYTPDNGYTETIEEKPHSFLTREHIQRELREFEIEQQRLKEQQMLEEGYTPEPIEQKGVAQQDYKSYLHSEFITPESEQEAMEQISTGHKDPIDAILDTLRKRPSVGDVAQRNVVSDAYADLSECSVSDRLAGEIYNLSRDVGINDCYVIARMLFDGDMGSMMHLFEQLDLLSSFDEAIIYLSENYRFDSENSATKLLVSLIKRRFSLK